MFIRGLGSSGVLRSPLRVHASFCGAVGAGGACQIFGWSHAAAFVGSERRSQNSSKRPLSLLPPEGDDGVGPFDRPVHAALSRVPITTLHPASTTAVDVHNFGWWNLG